MTEEQAIIEKTELKVPATFKALVEALVFAAQEPLSMSQIRSIYQGEGPRSDVSRQVEPEAIRQIIADLNKEYTKHERPYRIVQIAGGYQFATLPEYAEWLGKLYKEQGRRKLSQSGIETLAIIAYKQPITKAEVEKIRGVNCDYVLKNLLEKELLAVTGRAETVGRPLLYGTTREFLKHFGLNDITDLPRPREIEEILGESQFETERRMLEAQAGTDQARKEQEEFKSRLPHIPKKKSDLDEKNVEIIPHKINREIKLTPAEERKTLEGAGQEKIGFTAEPATPSVQSASGSSTDEIQNEISSAQFIKEDLPENFGQKSSRQINEQLQNDFPAEKEEIQLEDVGNVKNPGADGQDTDAVIIQDAVQDVPYEEHTQTQKRWKVWKEKIQGFIRKLFA